MITATVMLRNGKRAEMDLPFPKNVMGLVTALAKTDDLVIRTELSNEVQTEALYDFLMHDGRLPYTGSPAIDGSTGRVGIIIGGQDLVYMGNGFALFARVLWPNGFVNECAMLPGKPYPVAHWRDYPVFGDDLSSLARGK